MSSRHLVIGFVVLVALDLLVVPAGVAIGIILIGVACTRRRSVPAPRAHEPEDILV